MRSRAGRQIQQAGGAAVHDDLSDAHCTAHSPCLVSWSDEGWRAGREEAEGAGRPSAADQERVGGADLPATAPVGPGQAGLDVPTVRLLEPLSPCAPQQLCAHQHYCSCTVGRRLLPAPATLCTSKHSWCATGPVTNCCPPTGPAAALLRGARHKPVRVCCGRLHRPHTGAAPKLVQQECMPCAGFPTCLAPLPSAGRLVFHACPAALEHGSMPCWRADALMRGCLPGQRCEQRVLPGAR